MRGPFQPLASWLRGSGPISSGLLLAGLFAGNHAAHADPARFPPVQVEDRVVHYPIAGRDFAELRLQLANHGPRAAAPGHGRTHAEFEIASALEPTGDSCHLDAAAVSLRVTITLPQWDERGASAETIGRWAESISLLERHEAGHRRHAVAAASALREALVGLGPESDCRRLQWVIDRRLQRAVWKLEMLGNRYDSRTANGWRDDPLRDNPRSEAAALPD